MNHRQAVTLWVLILAVSGSPHASSSESETAASAGDEATQTAAEARSTPAPPADGQSANGQNGTGDVFLPSEEISEDFAVSFPVDI